MGFYKRMTKQMDQKLLDMLAFFSTKPNGLIPFYHKLQEELGYIPKEFIPQIASSFNLSQAEAYGVLTFYADFRTEPTGKNILKICRAEACQANGCHKIITKAKEVLDIDFGQTTADGKLTLLPTYCFGNCANGPSVSLNGRLYGRVNTQKMEKLLASIL
ncbi:NAD-dependent formate dehydrogenase gamma subunit [Methylacidiphilum infernorum V4]|uniref:NAD-dependent formate dehydrogenase gamma subunit n=2 Tax=Methylacidiphilum infernorum (isolate V4) TaxID=481448 RepID=B3DVD2_METI4|nr:NAD-dependent formate dehydrogenase gamma subunit [Methylacidiphilum infernorum V4]